MKVGSWEVVQFQSKGDDRGELISLENFKEVPFETKRVYYIIKTKAGVTRGLHAHRHLEQVLIAIAGSCKIKVENGQSTETYVLNDCKTGLRISNLVWREMSEFSPDCVLLVLASEVYDPSDYIRDRKIFLQESAAFYQDSIS